MVSRDMFNGFLFCTAIKYHLRAGNKQGESYEKDIVKRDRYFAWLYNADVLGAVIDPSLDYELPVKYKEMYIRNIDFYRKLKESIR